MIFYKKKLRKRGPSPALSGAEVLTMETVVEFLKIGSDKGIYDYFKHNWLSWFPALTSRVTFVKQTENLWALKRVFHQHLAFSYAQNEGLFFLTVFQFLHVILNDASALKRPFLCKDLFIK
ncbi:MAG TPA: hypothetical protein VI959_04400 [Alphaproteobacteria bacterium]|nr:hypothetical protein [Alphaproteobacteria bacterium]